MLSMMISQNTIGFALILMMCADAFIWSNAMTRSQSISIQIKNNTNKKNSNSKLNMVSMLAEKQRSLGLVKERFIGREDFVSIPVDEVEDYNSFAEADEEEIDPPKKGETITGVIIEVDENGAFIEIGGKMSGYIPAAEATLIPVKNVGTIFQIGQEVTGEMVGTLKGMPVISLRSAQLVVAWEKALKMKATDETFTVKVLEVNRGGAVCDFLGLKAFLPGSHFIGIADASLIGSTIDVKFLDANEEEGKIVVSQRRAMTSHQSVNMKRGTVLTGTVTGLRQYGAFLELPGGLAGLLHISQISFDRIENLENVFSVGEKVKVMIIDFDKTNNKIALSTKTLEPTPGEMLRNKALVFEKAEETAQKYQERLEAERLAREAATKDIVAGFGGALDDSAGSSAGGTVDPLNVVSVADSIESILASIVSNSENKPSS